MSAAVGIGYIGNRTEDAVVAHLATIVDAPASVLPANTIDGEYPEPCVVVNAAANRPGIPDAYQPNLRAVELQVHVRTHAARNLADARETHAALVNTVADALHADGMEATLNALATPGVLFSQFQVGDIRRGQSDGSFVTIINVDVLASWKEITP
jgi:hypothetical protein